jgi:hypothetical protein
MNDSVEQIEICAEKYIMELKEQGLLSPSEVDINSVVHTGGKPKTSEM